MRLKKIVAYNFRNYEKVEESFSDDKNIFILSGDNAQGKTNLLEAIYLLKFGCLFDKKGNSSAINFNAHSAKVELFCETARGNISVQIIFSRNSKKKYFLNNKTVSGPVNIKGNVHVITFLPQDLNIIKRGPDERRKFFNEELSSAIPRYFENLKYYNYSLKQKNILLKQKSNQNYLKIWNKRLALYGAQIIYDRKKYIADINKKLSEIHAYITENRETAALKYNSSIQERSESEIHEAFSRKLASIQTQEIQRGFSLTGPHRDDFDFLINRQSIKKFSSQGQKRNMLLSVKISKIEFLKEMYQEYPIVLLDDVFSELDATRQKNFLSYIDNKFQVFITSAQHLEYNAHHTEKIIIKKGRIFREK